MNQITSNIKIEILQLRIAVIHGFLAFAKVCPCLSTVALCVVGGFSILEKSMQKPLPINNHPDYVDIDVQAREYQKRCEKEDAKRFQEYTQKDVSQALARRVVSHA